MLFLRLRVGQRINHYRYKAGDAARARNDCWLRLKRAGASQFRSFRKSCRLRTERTSPRRFGYARPSCRRPSRKQHTRASRFRCPKASDVRGRRSNGSGAIRFRKPGTTRTSDSGCENTRTRRFACTLRQSGSALTNKNTSTRL